MSEKRQFTPEAGPKTIHLDDVFDSTREVPATYKLLILAQELLYDELYTPERAKYSEAWTNWKPFLPQHTHDFFRRRLARRVLVDLGGFEEDMQHFAHTFQVSTYINVDRFIGAKGVPPNPLAALSESDIEGLHRIDVKADLLESVARIRDNSVNFVLNGINRSGGIRDKKYHEALAQELVRTTQKGGIVFGAGAEVDDIWRHSDNPPLIDRRQELGFSELFVYEKPE